MKNLITIGLPSKGRLKEKSISFFEKNNLKLTSDGGERNYFAQIENLPNSKIIYLHAKEIIHRLGDGTIDLGISGLDLLQESLMNLQKKIEIICAGPFFLRQRAGRRSVAKILETAAQRRS